MDLANIPCSKSIKLPYPCSAFTPGSLAMPIPPLPHEYTHVNSRSDTRPSYGRVPSDQILPPPYRSKRRSSSPRSSHTSISQPYNNNQPMRPSPATSASRKVGPSPMSTGTSQQSERSDAPPLSAMSSGGSSEVRRNGSQRSARAGNKRKRKYTRTRTGCLCCRKRRIKCDEARPTCQRCVIAKREVSTCRSRNLRDHELIGSVCMRTKRLDEVQASVWRLGPMRRNPKPPVKAHADDLQTQNCRLRRTIPNPFSPVPPSIELRII